MKWLKQKNNKASEKEYTNFEIISLLFNEYSNIILYLTIYAIILLTFGIFVGFILGYQGSQNEFLNMIDQNLTPSQIRGLML